MTELVRIRETCRLCDSADLVCSVPLAAVPIVSPNVGTETDEHGRVITQVVASLDTYLCRACGLIQLVHVVDPALIYRDYRYRTTISMGLSDHFADLAAAVCARIGLKMNDYVVEFGSNDGTLLRFFKAAGAKVEGVDPATEIAKEATQAGIPTRADFFGQTLAADIRRTSGAARVILANNAMANIDDLADVLYGVAALLASDGMFVFETQYALDVFERTLLDVIYHEHISCFSIAPVVSGLGRYGLEVFDAERISTKGGSVRFWVQRKGGPYPRADRLLDLMRIEEQVGLHDLDYHARFAGRVLDLKEQLHQMIDVVKANGGMIAGYGTSVGSAALIHQFELESALTMLFDDTPFKERLEGPGYELPVYRGDQLDEMSPALTIVLAWRYAAPIAAKQRHYVANGGRFVVPLPAITTIP